ncbi:DUF2384 domain-containing protein [Pseudoalteromonas sp. SR45-1]|uniref:antitoxin Xre/MbcA/ParS toxin-binding domain-containing protein n=1 Tax=Pseudoalteromonas sp. SR45-1 TaxID=2760932 RepID=UPI0016009BD9|nr:antitoxin Xre/MbcA/ParS toxin-binding domain-containing protein [Pseudoalteromonas sp. SR45-1]MBB1327374.1 DUF2384 domain-containing protein [Pseudoalteromonas sp. SR45-1]
MDDHAGNISEKDKLELTRIAYKVFLNIMDAWSINTKQQRVLLGSPEISEFELWQQGNTKDMNHDVIMRISYIVGIYKGLGLIFNDRVQADKWVNKPNQEFNDRSAITFMLEGNIEQLKRVREFVDNSY